jgi:hypothetical protein
MGTLHQNGKGVHVEIKAVKLKKEHISILSDKLMIMKWKDKKTFIMSATHDDEMVSATVRGKDIIKPKVVAD